MNRPNKNEIGNRKFAQRYPWPKAMHRTSEGETGSKTLLLSKGLLRSRKFRFEFAQFPKVGRPGDARTRDSRTALTLGAAWKVGGEAAAPGAAPRPRRPRGRHAPLTSSRGRTCQTARRNFARCLNRWRALFVYSLGHRCVC